MWAGGISHTVSAMSRERVTPDADAMALDLRRKEPTAAGPGGSSATDALNRHLVQKLRDQLGIAFGMAESIPELVNDLRRLSEGSSAFVEIAATLDELERAGDLIKNNVTRTLRLVERDFLPESARW